MKVLSLRKMKIIREALKLAMLFSKSESETAEFALLLVEFEKGILKIENEYNS